MTLKTRVAKLESQAPTDEIIEVLGVKMKMPFFKETMRLAEGTALRPRTESSRYVQMNSTLKNRLNKLEASQPEKDNSLAHLTDEELDAEMFASCKKLATEGVEIDLRAALYCMPVREFFTDEPWTRDANHRISVFQEFLGIAHKQDLPEKIIAVFGLGWRNDSIPKEDIELTLKVLHDADLGKEAPWLKGYLEHSGVINEY